MGIRINEISDQYYFYYSSSNPPTPPTRKVYGFHINATESNPSSAVTYLEDAVGMTPAHMGASSFEYGSWENAFFMPKPCILNNDGTVKWYINPNNYGKKLDSDEDSWHRNMSAAINVMMEWPLIWYKFEATDEQGSGNFYVSDEQVDESYHCWCNMDCDGNIIPHFYTAVYRSTPYYWQGSGSNIKYRLRSMSSYPLITTSDVDPDGGLDRDTEYLYATNNNVSDKQEWATALWCDRVLISALLVLISKTLDSQSAFGNGYLIPIDSSEYPGRIAAGAAVSGSLDSAGLFYGNTTDGSEHVKVFGMEDFWGFTAIRVWGAWFSGGSGTIDPYVSVKLTYGTQDGSSGTGWNNYQYYKSTYSAPYEYSGVEHTVDGWVNNLSFTESGFFPRHVGFTYDGTGGNNIFECDGYYMNSTHVSRWLSVGAAFKSLETGPEQDIKEYGLFSMYEFIEQSNLWYVGTMLSCKPVLSASE